MVLEFIGTTRSFFYEEIRKGIFTMAEAGIVPDSAAGRTQAEDMMGLVESKMEASRWKVSVTSSLTANRLGKTVVMMAAMMISEEKEYEEVEGDALLLEAGDEAIMIMCPYSLVPMSRHVRIEFVNAEGGYTVRFIGVAPVQKVPTTWEAFMEEYIQGKWPKMTQDELDMVQDVYAQYEWGGGSITLIEDTLGVGSGDNPAARCEMCGLGSCSIVHNVPGFFLSEIGADEPNKPEVAAPAREPIPQAKLESWTCPECGIVFLKENEASIASHLKGHANWAKHAAEEKEMKRVEAEEKAKREKQEYKEKLIRLGKRVTPTALEGKTEEEKLAALASLHTMEEGFTIVKERKMAKSGKGPRLGALVGTEVRIDPTLSAPEFKELQWETILHELAHKKTGPEHSREFEDALRGWRGHDTMTQYKIQEQLAEWKSREMKKLSPSVKIHEIGVD